MPVWLKLPLLFDLLVGGLMAGGCLLLLLGLRAERGSHVPSVSEANDFERTNEAVDPTAERQRAAVEVAEASEPKIQPELALLNVPLLGVGAAIDGEFSTEHNKYARSVSAALAKSRKLSAG
jgi:hypothetical protein